MRRMLLGAAIMLLALVVWPTSAALAEEKPITVPLSYIANLSNTGATTATGTAEIWRIDAEVRLTTQGMMILPAGQVYALWLVNPQAGRFLPVSRFNVASDGSASLDVSLQGSIADTYTLVLVTVQPDPQSNHSVPSAKYAIVGFFPGNAAIQQQVTQLPDTGQYAQHPPFEPASAIVPDNPAPASGDGNPWLPAVPLAVAALSFAFVLRKRRSA